LQRSWEVAPYAAKDCSDVDFTAGPLDYLETNLCIDKSRIYAAGKSNGGGFVGKLACSLSSRIAAFAPISGAFYTNVSKPCNPSRMIIPIIDFHGMADTTIRYYGGNNTQGFWLDPIPEMLRARAKGQNCKDPQTPTNVEKKEARANKNMKLEVNVESKDEYWRSSWSCVVTPGAVETIIAYNITGLKHAWPSTKPNGDSDVSTVLNATPIVIKFFEARSLAGPTLAHGAQDTRKSRSTLVVMYLIG
jgi:polyhydroxybutyrate depolymerase